MNSVLLFVEIAVCFSAVILAEKFSGKYGLIAWIGVASVLANIITAKTSNIVGLDAAQGSVLFASTFLCTDILCEKYGKKLAKIGVFCRSVLYCITDRCDADCAVIQAC